MHLLNVNTHQLEYYEGSDVPPYAILSHRWEKGEVLFKEVQKGRQAQWPGWKKILLCCQQALKDGFSYVWIDTCCIDKRSSAELSEAINSMYNWYKEAQVCYAYLSDVGIVSDPDTAQAQPGQLHTDFTDSVWFTRGWTLQELLAPGNFWFYDRFWNCIGSKQTHANVIEARTSVPADVLQDETLVHDQSVALRMSWAAARDTARIEDRAYCLLGLFNVNMPLLYGERDRSFQRLLKEIAASSNDASIFAAMDWSPNFSETPMFPVSLNCFQDSSRYRNLVVDREGRYSISKGRIELSGQIILPYKLDYFIWLVTVNRDHERMVVEGCYVLLQKQRHLNIGPPTYNRILLDSEALLGHAVRAWTRPSYPRTSAIVEASHSPVAFFSHVYTHIMDVNRDVNLRCWPVYVHNCCYNNNNHLVHGIINTRDPHHETAQTTLWRFDNGQRWRSFEGGSNFGLLLAYTDLTSGERWIVLAMLCTGYNAFREPVCFVEELGRSHDDDESDKMIKTGSIVREGLGTFELLSNIRNRRSGQDCTQLHLMAGADAIDPWQSTEPSVFHFGGLFDIYIAEARKIQDSRTSTGFVTSLDFHVLYEGEKLPDTWHQSVESRGRFYAVQQS